ncbi:MAG: hypothetical protein QNJ22_05285 [Desulfosarcinaceae bacterium]|nr:hypothetical protein [Desulfosarcinaceae bacterium]
MLLIVKILTATLIVVTLSVVAEKVSPRISGLLAGYPLGTAMALFFYGLELGPRFAADAAVYALLGLIATESFVYIYYHLSLRLRRWSALLSSLGATTAFLLVAQMFSHLPAVPSLVMTLTVLSMGLFIYLLRKLPDVTIGRPVRLGPRVLLLRALLSAGLIVLITAIARLVGERWAGLLSGFPITLFPLILIIHLTYRSTHVHTIIKNFPRGMGALVLYSISVHLLYPPLGIYLGTAAAFGVATLYLVALLRLSPAAARA